MEGREKESKLKDLCVGFGAPCLGLIFLATLILSEGVYKAKEYFKTLPYRIP